MIVLVKTVSCYRFYEFSKQNRLLILGIKGEYFSSLSIVEIPFLLCVTLPLGYYLSSM